MEQIYKEIIDLMDTLSQPDRDRILTLLRLRYNIYMSPEALEDIRNWDKEAGDDLSGILGKPIGS